MSKKFVEKNYTYQEKQRETKRNKEKQRETSKVNQKNPDCNNNNTNLEADGEFRNIRSVKNCKNTSRARATNGPLIIKKCLDKSAMFLL